MAPKPEEVPVPFKTPDPAKLADAWTRALVNGAEVIRAATERSMVAPASAPYDPLAPLRAFSDFTKSLWSNPARLPETRHKLFAEWSELWTGGGARALGQERDPSSADQRGENGACAGAPLLSIEIPRRSQAPTGFSPETYQILGSKTLNTQNPATKSTR